MWINVHEADLNASLSLAEIEAFRKSADFEADPVEKQIAAVVAFVRGCIRSGGKARMSTDESLIPESLVLPAMDYLRYQILTRMNINVNESRTEAWRSAKELFDQLRQGEYIPESDTVTDDSEDRAGSPATGKPNPGKRLLDD